MPKEIQEVVHATYLAEFLSKEGIILRQSWKFPIAYLLSCTALEDAHDSSFAVRGADDSGEL